MIRKTKTVVAIASLLLVVTTFSGCDKIFKKGETTESVSVTTMGQESDMYSGDFAVSTPQVSSQGLGKIASDSRKAKLSLLSINNTEGHPAFLRYIITISASGNDGYLDASVFDLSGKDGIKKLYMINGGKIVQPDEYKKKEHGDIIGVRFVVDVGRMDAPGDKPAYLTTDLTVTASDKITPDYVNSCETVVSIRTQVSSVGGETDEWVTVDEMSVSSLEPDGEDIDVQSALENYFIPDLVLAPVGEATVTAQAPNIDDPGMPQEGSNIPSDDPNEDFLSDEPEVPQEEEPVPNTEAPAETTVTTAETTAETTTETTASTDIAPTSLSLNTGYVELEVGQSSTLQATFEPSNATQTSLTWSSANNSVATVSNGTITAVGEGSTTISCTTVNGMTLQVSVVVKSGQTAPASNEITAIKFDKSEVRLGIGEAYTLSISVEPSNITELNATWSNADPNVATVNGSGTITAVGEGTTTITLTADNGVNAYCNIIVE